MAQSSLQASAPTELSRWSGSDPLPFHVRWGGDGGKFVSGLNDSSPQITRPQLLYNPQKNTTRALHNCFFSIILSPPLAPWSWERCRGADVAPLLALLHEAREWKAEHIRRALAGYSKSTAETLVFLLLLLLLEEGQFSRTVEATNWLRHMGGRSHPAPEWLYLCSRLAESCLCLPQPDPQLISHTA